MDQLEYEKIKQQYADDRWKRSIILAVCAGALILAVIIIISSFIRSLNDPQREIAKESKELLSQAEQQVDDGEYDDALDTLNQIDTSWDNYEKVDDVRLEAVKGQLKAKLAEYEAAGNYQAIISMIKDNISNINEDAEVKAAYKSAVQDYRAEAISDADEYAAAGDYMSARSTLTVAVNFIGEDVEISEKLKEINQMEVLEVVLSYEAEGNYKAAIVYLNENSSVVSGSADLQEKLSIYTEKYRTNVISEAASEYKANGYEAAISVLSSALKILTYDDVLISEKAKYEQTVPVSLTDLDVIKQGDYVEVGVASTEWFGTENSEYYTDVSGNTYSTDGIHCIHVFDDSLSDGDGLRSITYYLNQDFAVLTGVMYRPYVTLSCDFDWSTDGRLEIYGDGILLCEEKITQKTFDAIKLNVDVTGVRELTLVFRGSWRGEKSDYFTYYYWHPKFCLADLAVAKAPG